MDTSSAEVDALLEGTLWDHYWLPPWATRVEREEVIYTRSDRPLQALNMVVKVRAQGAALEGVVEEVSAAHAGVPSRWLLSASSRSAELEGLLAEHGYAEEHQHFAYAVDPRRWQPRAREDLVVEAVADARGIREVISVAARAFGDPDVDPGEDRVADELAGVTGPAPRTHRFLARDSVSGAPLSGGGMNWFPELRVGFLWGGGTVPEGRGRGAYRAVVDARVARAAALGAGLVGVYARVDTSAPILEALGFTRHGPLVSWSREA